MLYLFLVAVVALTLLVVYFRQINREERQAKKDLALMIRNKRERKYYANKRH